MAYEAVWGVDSDDNSSVLGISSRSPLELLCWWNSGDGNGYAVDGVVWTCRRAAMSVTG